jgi:protein phosphatase
MSFSDSVKACIMYEGQIFQLKSVESYMDYTYLSVSEHGKIRDQNEDSVGIFHTEFGILIIICDGLGGGLSGEFASRLSVETIHKTFVESQEVDFLKRIRSSIEKANKFVYEKSNGNLNFKGMATTCEVLLLNGVSAFWGHIGDSRIYFYKNKKLTQLTKDHSLIQKLMDDGVLAVKDFKNHPKKSVITKAIGDDQIPEIDTSKILLPNKSQMKFFVCTDGVTCVVNDIELENLFGDEDLNEISDKLNKLIDRRGAPDNYSYVLVSN